MALMGVCYSCSREGEELLLISETLESFSQGTTDGLSGKDEAVPEKEEAGQAAPSGQAGEASQADKEVPCFFVHICGAVAAPGVYEMPEGSRVYQAVEAAGGFLSQADEGYLNLAAPVHDGMKITVYTREEAKTAPAPEALSEGLSGKVEGKESGAKVNINTAGKEELMTLKGIGESRAEDIIAYRKKLGAFSEIEEIMQVPGIKDGAFQKIKEQITVQ